MRRKAKHIIGMYMPRWLALIWAIWAALTARAYVHKVPPQLAGVDQAINLNLWAVWATAAILLIAGATVPICANHGWQDTARWCRIAGMAIMVTGLSIWAVAFTIQDGRGWVTGKNYALMAIFAALSTWIIARNRGGVARGH